MFCWFRTYWLHQSTLQPTASTPNLVRMLVLQYHLVPDTGSFALPEDYSASAEMETSPNLYHFPQILGSTEGPIGRRNTPKVPAQRAFPSEGRRRTWATINALVEVVQTKRADINQLRAQYVRIAAENFDLREQLTEAQQHRVKSDPSTESVAILKSDGFEIAEIFIDLADAIRESTYILDLEEDWDDEGSPAYCEKTWRDSIRFVIELMTEAWKLSGIAPASPRIHHGPGGGIDFHWDLQDKELLVHYPPEADECGDYYGETNDGKHQIRGVIEPGDRRSDILLWLVS